MALARHAQVSFDHDVRLGIGFKRQGAEFDIEVRFHG